MSRSVRNLFVVLVTLAVNSPFASHADEELTWYAIEVIVFERTSEAAPNGEAWPGQPGLPDFADAVELSLEGVAPVEPQGGESSDTQIEAPTSPASTLRAFQLVAPQAYRLGDAWERLNASGAYRPLLHVAWIQPGYASDDSQLVHLRNANAALGRVAPGGGEGTAAESESSFSGLAPSLSADISVARDPSKVALDGTVRVHRARYLHVEADLLYYRPSHGGIDAMETPSADVQVEAVPDSPDTAFTEQLLTEDDTQATLFRLTESRRMRSRELHYLDHPLFGLLVEAWPVELPEAPEAPAEATLPAEQGGATQTPTEGQSTTGG